MQEAAKEGADVIVLPEIWNCSYNKEIILKNLETIDDYKTNEACVTTRILSQLAKETCKYIIGGSIGEKSTSGEKYYNTCVCFDREGEIRAKYSKMHLFDIDIPGKITFKESEFMLPGNKYTVFETEYCKVLFGLSYRFAVDWNWYLLRYQVS